MLSVGMLGVIMLSVIMLSVVMLSVVMLSVVVLSVVILSVIMLSVVAPFYNPLQVTQRAFTIKLLRSFNDSSKNKLESFVLEFNYSLVYNLHIN